MPLPLPNYTQVPNILFDLMPSMGQAEFFVTMAIVRKIIGFHKERDGISLSQLQAMTGLSRPAVVRGLESAIARGIVKSDGQGKRNMQYFTLNFELVTPSDLEQIVTSNVELPVTSNEKLPDNALTSNVELLTKEKVLKEKKKEKDIALADASAETVPPKPKKPRTPAQLVNDAKGLTLARCFSPNLTELNKVDGATFGRIAGQLISAGIAIEEFAPFVTHIRKLAKEQGNWTVTPNSLLANGRPLAYTEQRKAHQAQAEQRANSSEAELLERLRIYQPHLYAIKMQELEQGGNDAL